MTDPGHSAMRLRGQNVNRLKYSCLYAFSPVWVNFIFSHFNKFRKPSSLLAAVQSIRNYKMTFIKEKQFHKVIILIFERLDDPNAGKQSHLTSFF